MNDYCSMLKESLISKGASMVGFAELSSIPEHYRKGYKYGVSIVVALDPEIISQIEHGPTVEYCNEYKKTCDILDDLARYTAKFLEVCDYLAYPMLSNNLHVNQRRRKAYLPHKTVAYLSGLGWIGKNSLFVTKEYGSAVKMATVLTNAELDVGAPISNSKCGLCSKCVDACDVNEILGTHWNVQEGAPQSAYQCGLISKGVNNIKDIDKSICGQCMVICPWTKAYIKRSLLLRESYLYDQSLA